MSAPAVPASTNAGFAAFEKELICSICTEVLYQPLTILNCLHTFCGSCLKEWFSHQHRKASSSRAPTSPENPYSCPTCRAEVIDVQHNATVSNLLELFLAANPTRNRSQDEKDEMDKLYKPDGTRPRNKILPKVERRRERRSRRDDANATRDQRIIEEARQRSLAVLDQGSTTAMLLPPATGRERSASNEREERRHRRRDRERQRETAHGYSDQYRHTDSSPPSSSPRHPDAIELRQREQRMSHQASLRSMVSAGEMGGSATGTGDAIDEARIMQEIIDEGLLGDIDVDALTEEEQDRLAERIAELYRQRHSRQMQRDVESPAAARAVATSTSSHLQTHDDNHHRHRSSSGRRSTLDVSAPSEPRARSNSARPQQMPPTSIARSNSQGSSSVTFHHRRRRSDQAHLTSTGNRSRQSSQERNSAVSTSFSNLAVSSDNDRRPSSTQTRTNTDPAMPSFRASQTWSQMGAESAKPHQRSSTTPVYVRKDSIPRASATKSPRNTVAELNGEYLPELVTFEEPNISCFRCRTPDLVYKLHRHCSICEVDLCMRCYRFRQGCNHWLGFRNVAKAEFQRRRESGEDIQPSHTLMARKYQPPPETSIISTRTLPDETTVACTTSSNPVERLQEGRFCDRCFSFANSQCWLCSVCNDGDWCFCKQCVQTHHCCTHPLLPVAFQPPSDFTKKPMTKCADNQLSPPDTPKSRPLTPSSTISYSRLGPGYDYLSINVNCDMCHDIIFPSTPRLHCPFHFTDYDICSSCYASYLAQLRMRRDPLAEVATGWRKCPSGHRMIIVAFEGDMQDDGSIDSDNGIRRIVKADLVGGWKMTEQDQATWNHEHGLQSAQSTAPPPVRGKWTWKEDGSGTKRTRNRTFTLSESRFPPNGGAGQRATVGRYGYWPEDGVDGEGELPLPSSAEITEVEDVNGEWCDGVYAGDIGVFPSNYAVVHP